MSRDPFQERYDHIRKRIERHLGSLVAVGSASRLRDACRYVLTGGGKRLRAILVLLSSEAVGGTAARALPAGAAVEIMHNFTLVHDDIMDNASARRGRPTVHTQWDLNTALLAGDTLLAVAYRTLLTTRVGDHSVLVDLLTRSVIDVCEGQALDLEFELRTDVSLADYFAMIERKTGRLISVATELGALVGGGQPEEIRALRRFGHNLGKAFQLQDDLLDVIGEEREFGKTIGGDIVEGKRTFLLLTALERARDGHRDALQKVLERKTVRSKRSLSPRERRTLVSSIRALYVHYGVLDETRKAIMHNTTLAVRALAPLRPTKASHMLEWLARKLVDRVS